MDDPKTDREGGGLMPRFRVSLRLLMLLVTMACVCFAYIRARTDFNREKIREEIFSLEVKQRNLREEVRGLKEWKLTPEPTLAPRLAKVQADIGAKKQQIGESEK